MTNDYYPGKGCECSAHNRQECGCDVDWTDPRVYRLERELAASKEDLAKAMSMIDRDMQCEVEVARLREALELIASPMRPDGTYNRERRACELLAKEALATEPVTGLCLICHENQTTCPSGLCKTCYATKEPVTGKSVKFSVDPSFSEKCKVCGEAYGDHMGHPDALNCPKDPFPPKEEPVIRDSRITEPAPEWRELGPDELICEGDEFLGDYDGWMKCELYVGKKAELLGKVRTRRPLPTTNCKQISSKLVVEPKQEEMPLEDEIASIEWSCAHTARAIRYLRDEIQKLKEAL